MIIKTTEVEDALCIAHWQSFIADFKKITDSNPIPEKVKNKLLELKSKAQNSIHLTYRQREGIYGRCNNYINDNYGKDAIKESYKAPSN